MCRVKPYKACEEQLPRKEKSPESSKTMYRAHAGLWIFQVPSSKSRETSVITKAFFRDFRGPCPKMGII